MGIEGSGQGRGVDVLVISSGGWRNCCFDDEYENAMSVCVYIPFVPGVLVMELSRAKLMNKRGSSTKSS